jgi:hypothetical protein
VDATGHAPGICDSSHLTSSVTSTFVYCPVCD